jgi:pimeloyl-ACP methyl ester carboxylesterase
MVFALSVKTSWVDEEVARFRALSDQPVRWMETREQAGDRLLRASGLTGLLPPDARFVSAGLREEPGSGFCFASDPRVFASAATGVDKLLFAARCPLYFATGEDDPMATPDQMMPFDPEATIVPRTGHNAHVEDPEAVWELFIGKYQKLRRC